MDAQSPKVYHHRLLDSTQYEAERLLPLYQNAKPGVLFVVTAHAQTKGRGRFNRTWTAPGGTCSLTTFTVRIPEKYYQQAVWLTGLGALSAYEAITENIPELAEDLNLKWPNDLMIDGLKLGGVLATALNHPRADYPWVDVACGIGINTSMKSAQLPVTTATSIQVALEKRGKSLNLNTAEIRKLIIARTLKLITQWQEADYDATACGQTEKYQKLLTTLGQEVTATVLTESSPREIRGILSALTPNGRAVVETETGKQIISAADVTLRLSEKNIPVKESH